jgi:hypothetical protein
MIKIPLAPTERNKLIYPGESFVVSPGYVDMINVGIVASLVDYSDPRPCINMIHDIQTNGITSPLIIVISCDLQEIRLDKCNVLARAIISMGLIHAPVTIILTKGTPVLTLTEGYKKLSISSMFPEGDVKIAVVGPLSDEMTVGKRLLIRPRRIFPLKHICISEKEKGFEHHTMGQSLTSIPEKPVVVA